MCARKQILKVPTLNETKYRLLFKDLQNSEAAPTAHSLLEYGVRGKDVNLATLEVKSKARTCFAHL